MTGEQRQDLCDNTCLLYCLLQHAYRYAANIVQKKIDSYIPIRKLRDSEHVLIQKIVGHINLCTLFYGWAEWPD